MTQRASFEVVLHTIQGRWRGRVVLKVTAPKFFDTLYVEGDEPGTIETWVRHRPSTPSEG